MGITITSIVLLITGIILLVVSENTHFDWSNAWYGVLGLFMTVLSVFGVIISVVFSLVAQIPKQKDYETALYERQVIEYRLENKSENVVGNELLYQDIVDYNNGLRSHKRYSDNFWLNWFYNDKIATIEYIEIEGVENYKDWGELWQNKA